jgi:hypothetical protein
LIKLKKPRKVMRVLKGSSVGWDEKKYLGFRLTNKVCCGIMGAYASPVLKQLILKEAHDTPYSIHPGGTKMYQDLKEQFCWHGMKREIAFYIARCDICQRVKAKHQRPAGLL